MKKGDLIIIAIIFIFAIGGFLYMKYSNDSDKYFVEVTYDGEVVEYFELTDDVDKHFHLEYEGHNELVVKDGVVDMIAADCPDQDCVHMEAIHIDSWNPTIICAPNKIVVRIVGGNNKLDGIV
ncbi:NusG domain II-containing protein [Mycoplasmatota bacterium WC44]